MRLQAVYLLPLTHLNKQANKTIQTKEKKIHFFFSPLVELNLDSLLLGKATHSRLLICITGFFSNACCLRALCSLVTAGHFWACWIYQAGTTSQTAQLLRRIALVRKRQAFDNFQNQCLSNYWRAIPLQKGTRKSHLAHLTE